MVERPGRPGPRATSQLGRSGLGKGQVPAPWIWGAGAEPRDAGAGGQLGSKADPEEIQSQQGKDSPRCSELPAGLQTHRNWAPEPASGAEATVGWVHSLPSQPGPHPRAGQKGDV